VIFSLIYSIILIKSLFKNYIKNKDILEKIIVVIFTVIAIGFFVSIGLLTFDTCPLYNLPYLFLRETPAFNNIILAKWIMPVLAIILVTMNVKLWYKEKWSLLKRGLYAIYTIWSMGIIWWFFYWNFFQI